MSPEAQLFCELHHECNLEGRSSETVQCEHRWIGSHDVEGSRAADPGERAAVARGEDYVKRSHV